MSKNISSKNILSKNNISKKMSTEITKLLEDNKIDDLKKFLSRRKCLNNCNLCLVYLFHIVQSAGILTTMIATSYSMTSVIWVGVGLNVFATLINVFEHTNNSISKRLLKDIEAIMNGTYVDEGNAVEPDKDNKEETKKNEIDV